MVLQNSEMIFFNDIQWQYFFNIILFIHYLKFNSKKYVLNYKIKVGYTVNISVDLEVTYLESEI